MTDGSATLFYAVRLPVVAYYLGQLALMLALLTCAPLGVALTLGEHGFVFRFAVLVVSLGALGWLGLLQRRPGPIQTNEAIVVVSLAFVLTPLLMTWPLTLGGVPLLDAYFEAVSGVTTTGLSTAGSVAGRSPVYLFTRSWMQWYGGLGIAVLSVALLMGHHSAARRLIQPTALDNLATTARTQARLTLTVYLVLTVAGLLLLWLVLGNGFHALLLVLSAVSTGGFAPTDASLAGLPDAAAWIVTGVSLLGAVPLMLYFFATRRGPGLLLADPEVRALAVAVLLVGGLLALIFWAAGQPLGSALGSGFILGISAQTTSGFSALSVASLEAPTKLLLIPAMVIGGGLGSTAGGIKLLRLLILLRLMQYFLRSSAMPPHAVVTPMLAGQSLERHDVERVLLVIGLFLVAATASWFVFVLRGYPPVDALFEVISALGTVGLSSGIARPELEPILKLVLCADMLLGRLELIAVLVLLYPRTWIGKRA